MAESMLLNGADVWQALLQSGLNPRKSNGTPSYDEGIEIELNSKLFPLSSNSLKRNLASQVVSTESFLAAFFDTIQPFSNMLRDTFAMFEAASAKRGHENLKIAFNFDSATEELIITLQNFRQIEEQVRWITRSVLVRQWNASTLFKLLRTLQEAADQIGVPEIELFDVRSLQDRRLAVWILDSGRPNWLSFPGLILSGHERLDRALMLAQDLIRTMITEVRKLGQTYAEFAERLSKLPVHDVETPAEREAHVDESSMDHMPKRQFVHAAHDFWPNSFAHLLGVVVQHIVGMHDGSQMNAADQIAQAIENGFAIPPASPRTTDELERSFLEFINLPIWKKRHELYSVWVASQILSGLKHLDWEWHADGDTLRFPFSGAHLATLKSGGEIFQFWTEMRTELRTRGILGRRNIQPDYRILAAPIHRPEATVLVIECKQYRVPSRRNFFAALDDYALGCEAAQVVLVNYGNVSDSILESVHESRRGRTQLIGEFRPNVTSSAKKFQDALTKIFPVPQTDSISSLLPEFELSWGPDFNDLDLHLQIQPFEDGKPDIWVNYHKFGSGEREPWAWLEADIQSASVGREVIKVTRVLDANYFIFVHDFTESGRFPSGDMSLSVRLHPNLPPKVFQPKSGRYGHCWLPCVLNGEKGLLATVDFVFEELPSEGNG